jgi:large subunit ribosomal protein L2
MQLRKLKPRTPGTRHRIIIEKNLLAKTSLLYKNIIGYKHKKSGRSSTTGHITVWHRGSGCKKKYRNINFKNESKLGITIMISYDPNRNSFISLNFNFENKKFFSTIAPNLYFPGFIYYNDDIIEDLKYGFRTTLKQIPTGSLINNLSLSTNSISKYARSAGTFCQLIQKTTEICKIKLPSGKILELSDTAYATVGEVSNKVFNTICLGKAGVNRLRGFRPIVRGIAMNPVDHPHGGRANSGFVKVTPWGIPTKTKLKKRK